MRFSCDTDAALSARCAGLIGIPLRICKLRIKARHASPRDPFGTPGQSLVHPIAFICQQEKADRGKPPYGHARHLMPDTRVLHAVLGIAGKAWDHWFDWTESQRKGGRFIM